MSLKNLPQVGKGAFTRCYELDSETVLLETFDPIKKLMSEGKFPKSKLFPKVIPYKKKTKVGGDFYTMYYYKGRPNRCTSKWLKDNLDPDQFELYKVLYDLTQKVIEELKGKRNLDRRPYWIKAFKELEDKKLSKMLIKTYDLCCTVAENIRFDCFPHNVSVHKGKLILLDCFYSAALLFKLKFDKNIEWALPWQDKNVNKQKPQKATGKSEMAKSKHSIGKFKPADYNPRKISEEQLAALNKSIAQFGDLSGVVINKKTNTIISGHQRTKTMSDKDTRIVTEKFKDEFGTVEQGYIEVTSDDGTFKVPLRIVNWDGRQEKLANIAANSLGGDFDNQMLGKLLADLDIEKFEVEEFDIIGMSKGKADTIVRRALEDDDAGEKYVKKLASPIYKPTGKVPKLNKIFDTTKTDELCESINAAKIPEDVRQFLVHAAQRHTRINYAYAAEYYAQAPKRVQRLMEDVALVIVDFDKALEQGYLRMTEEIQDMIKNGEED